MSESSESVLHDVRRLDWQSWADPLHGPFVDYHPGQVLPAFESLVRATSAEQAQVAYDEMMSAIAHNHSGTSYAAMTPATPLLVKLVPHLRDEGAAAALQILIDIVLWSVDRPIFSGPDGVDHDPRREVVAAVTTLKPLMRQWASGHDGNRTRAAAELLVVLENPAS